MHILVVNDDGPPAVPKSPFIAPFVRTLAEAGHSVSVVVPHIPRSWMSKGHIRHQDVHAHVYRRDGSCSDGENWLTVDGTPAACVQIGLFHGFKTQLQVDLVVTGPNAGKNVGTISNLCSGTLGAAMEAALCGKRAIALSFAFGTEDMNVISTACLKSLKLIEHLYDHWPESIDVYNINVPLPAADRDMEIRYTKSLRNRWGSPSFYVDTEIDKDGTDSTGQLFRWAPSKADVQRSFAHSSPGTDAWAVKEGFISVTPMSADYAHVEGVDSEISFDRRIF